jgi:hypothetical protein
MYLLALSRAVEQNATICLLAGMEPAILIQRSNQLHELQHPIVELYITTSSCTYIVGDASISKIALVEAFRIE